MKTYEIIFSELDVDARVNLGDRGVPEYEAYKASLLAESVSPENIEMILRGFIWSQLESDHDP